MLGCAAFGCRDTTEGVRTQFVGSYPFNATERRTIARIARDAAIEARRHLPSLASQITLRVTSGQDVVPEIGAAATATAPDWVQWTVDPQHPDGVVRIAERHLRGALFHEFHHLVRGNAVALATLIDHVVAEGLATAFERDAAGVSRPWAEYPEHAGQWLDQLLAQPEDANRAHWLMQHPDGRRWVGMKAGTYVADRAMRALGRSAAELATVPTSEILAAAR